ncbi:GNAT family N-acetyltransferase [Paenibacillus sp. N3/727]|uniref:GNAT family N-acetyltransferase n=1 Tax=Paenibacillus sp. N3/727 TaxID=2925845 RepID=UPI001F53C7D5|nr:GNAT family protein [Paenibacillus sp. N3/727]UNK20967.1 GNAT family N-acetyltransferase [Paenibacillus sp. N3/727]
MYIETERLVIRDFIKEDWQEVHAYASNLKVAEYMIWGPNTEEETLEYIDRVIAMQEAVPRVGYELGVSLKENGKIIGGCGLHMEGKNAEIGYCFHPDYWGKGYASETAKAMLTLGFQELGAHRIYATCRPANIGSAGVMIRNGMIKEGHLREHMYHKGKYHDSYLYSILKDEFDRSLLASATNIKVIER